MIFVLKKLKKQIITDKHEKLRLCEPEKYKNSKKNRKNGKQFEKFWKIGKFLAKLKFFWLNYRNIS